MEQYRGVLEHCLICKGETWNIVKTVCSAYHERVWVRRNATLETGIVYKHVHTNFIPTHVATLEHSATHVVIIKMGGYAQHTILKSPTW